MGNEKTGRKIPIVEIPPRRLLLFWSLVSDRETGFQSYKNSFFNRGKLAGGKVCARR